jgi:hypothetical protein
MRQGIFAGFTIVIFGLVMSGMAAFVVLSNKHPELVCVALLMLEIAFIGSEIVKRLP